MKRITLATLHLATAQEVFDQVRNHMLNQNAKSLSISPDGVEFCAYRSPTGLSCAAGCLIADREYCTAIDNLKNNSWETLVIRQIIPVSKHVKLINLLQTVHDRFSVEGWDKALIEVAAAEGLCLTN